MSTDQTSNNLESPELVVVLAAVVKIDIGGEGLEVLVFQQKTGISFVELADGFCTYHVIDRIRVLNQEE